MNTGGSTYLGDVNFADSLLRFGRLRESHEFCEQQDDDSLDGNKSGREHESVVSQCKVRGVLVKTRLGEVTEEVKGGWKVERDEGRRTNNESENGSQPNWSSGSLGLDRFS